MIRTVYRICSQVKGHKDIFSLKRQGSSNMTNINAVPVPRNQNTALNSTSFHLSNGIENVIDKIENLRLTHDTVDQSNEIRGFDAYRTKHSARRVPSCQTSNNNDIYDCDHDHDRENDRNDLIERGPIKSQFCSLTRSQPYWTSVEQPRNFQANETFPIDYDKTAEQILRDKECSEKLNACLDQLQDLERTSCTYDSNARDEDKSQVYSLRKDVRTYVCFFNRTDCSFFRMKVLSVRFFFKNVSHFIFSFLRLHRRSSGTL